MLKFIAILALAALCAAQKSSDYIKLEHAERLIVQSHDQFSTSATTDDDTFNDSDDLSTSSPDDLSTSSPDDFSTSSPDDDTFTDSDTFFSTEAPDTDQYTESKHLTESTYTSGMYSTGKLEIREPLPVEVAQSGLTKEHDKLPSETMEYPAPSLSVHAPLVNLPKGGQEVVDIPHANIRLPGNSIQNKDLHLNLPTPVVEAPKPIVENKDVLFRLPQPIFYVPRPVIQHKPIVFKVGHTLRPLLTKVNTRPYLFKVPQLKLAGKSSYTQTIPREFRE